MFFRSDSFYLNDDRVDYTNNIRILTGKRLVHVLGLLEVRIILFKS